MPDETVSPVTDPAETDPAETDPTETDPLETNSVPSGIPDPTMRADFTPRDGVIVNMGLFDGTEFGDTVGYASTIVAGGEFGSYQVIHKGETYTLPAYCKTVATGQVAAALGVPKACRAVGMAAGCNPILILVPCHRVIGADGSLTGYAGGLEMKRVLLALEAEHIPEAE